MNKNEKSYYPPKWADRFLKWYCRPDLLEEIQGDIYELFNRNLKNRTRTAANLNFIWNVLRFFNWKNIKRTGTHSSATFMMYKNYFTVFKRNLIKQKGYAFLNMLGLAVGIACFLLISFYIKDELSYDRFHSNADRIFRLHEITEKEGMGEYSASIPFPTAEALINDHDQHVLKFVRFFNFQLPSLAVSTSDNTKEFNESKLFFVDSTVFDVFDFKILKGDERNLLNTPNTVVLTRSMAYKYFGHEDPIGKYLTFQGATDLLITGVLEDLPHNAHFQFDFLVSFSTLKQFYQGQIPTSWHWNPCWTYFLLRDQSDITALQAAMPAFVKKYFPEFLKNDVRLSFIPLTDIHLKSNMSYEIEQNSSTSVIYILTSIALFVLLIACINFINLITARAVKRAKEVGLRKTLGGEKIQLVTQFLFESVSFCILSITLAIAIVLLILPFFNSLVEKTISPTILLNPFYLSVFALLPFILGIIAGIYPAFILSSFKPVSVLKGSFYQDRGAALRKILVIVQFGLSIILIICTGVAIDQLGMLKKNDTGFIKENILMIPVSRTPVGANYEALKVEFLRHPDVVGVTAIEDILGSKFQVTNYLLEGLEESRPFPRLTVRHDFLKTFDISLVAGRDYAQEFITDDSLALLVNEELVKTMGWGSNENALGKTFAGRPNRKIIGVVKNFNFASRHHAIEPLILDLNLNPTAFNWSIKYMAVRVTGNNLPASIGFLKQAWETLMPDWPFEYFFLENTLNELYKTESKLSKIAIVFSTLSILVACLGLFGLSILTAEQRKKEMSIRKVLGSSNSEIFTLFFKHFFTLILIANAIAFPLAYFLMRHWLSGFAYRVGIDWRLFPLAAISSISIAIVTICYQGLRTAYTNPAEVLKNE